MSTISRYERGHAFLNIVKDKGIILVDTGAWFTKQDYQDVFNEEGIDPKQIGLIVITHAHWDHFAGLSILKEMTKAPVLCHRNAVAGLRDGDDYQYPLRGEEGKKWSETFEPSTWQNPKDCEADVVVGDDDFDLTPYGIDGRIVYAPGHTNNSLAVVLGSGEALMGDFVMPSPFTGKLGFNLIVEDEEKIKESMKKLLGLAETFYDGHSGPFTKEELQKLI